MDEQDFESVFETKVQRNPAELERENEVLKTQNLWLCSRLEAAQAGQTHAMELLDKVMRRLLELTEPR